jgi:hypothetical protein
MSEQLRILKQGVEVWNEWRRQAPDARIDLSHAHLSRADLRGANFVTRFVGISDLVPEDWRLRDSALRQCGRMPLAGPICPPARRFRGSPP